ncbi:hypothetical protein RSOLAG22IIIB_12428 [Rhizoctonia solani]|uniref:Uncharacterized protein n=1 Tax=Rhizoctonia solani TaxID=456999 RepID=A0A0K6GDF1_9AGAM|nr:hypothetical protein RSOLAG22IIIB_12428 [Rhizoctonia solani]
MSGTQKGQAPEGQVLANVEPNSLKNVLEFTASKNDQGEKGSSLSVDEGWILDRLKESANPSDEQRQNDTENKPDETTHEPDNPKLEYTEDGTSKPEDPKELLHEVMAQIKKEFNIDGSERLEADGLGVGPNLSKLLKEVQGEGDDVNQSSNTAMRELLDPDGGTRDPESDMGTAGKEK